MDTENGFGPVSKALHWLIAALMLGLIWLGWWMIQLSYYSTWYHTAPALHKALGLCVFGLGLVLIVWRRFSARPAADASHRPWEKVASRVVHFALIACVIVIPVTGYIFTTSNGEAVPFFGLFELPALFAVPETLRDIAIQLHIYASYGLLAVVLLHAGGAIKHHLIDGDRTLRRMTW
ncbi:cytochrome b [Hoeflea sp. TYP-13]|uniref:cytochrome b n=1 Tax=Hoeflea sp. TYP-13 TaxID=3230023 RepID=UPI0034C63EE6